MSLNPLWDDKLPIEERWKKIQHVWLYHWASDCPMLSLSLDFYGNIAFPYYLSQFLFLLLAAEAFWLEEVTKFASWGPINFLNCTLMMFCIVLNLCWMNHFMCSVVTTCRFSNFKSRITHNIPWLLVVTPSSLISSRLAHQSLYHLAIIQICQSFSHL